MTIDARHIRVQSGGGLGVDGDELKATGGGLVPRAWVVFTGGAGTLLQSEGVASVVRNSEGFYTINFSSDMADTDFCFVGHIEGEAVSPYLAHFETQDRSVGSHSIRTYDESNVLVDANRVCLVYYR